MKHTLLGLKLTAQVYTTTFSFLVQKNWLMEINFHAGFTEVFDVFGLGLNFTGDFILNLQKCQRYLSTSCADFPYKILRHCFHPGRNSEYFGSRE